MKGGTVVAVTSLPPGAGYIIRYLDAAREGNDHARAHPIGVGDLRLTLSNADEVIDVQVAADTPNRRTGLRS